MIRARASAPQAERRRQQKKNQPSSGSNSQSSLVILESNGFEDHENRTGVTGAAPQEVVFREQTPPCNREAKSMDAWRRRDETVEIEKGAENLDFLIVVDRLSPPGVHRLVNAPVQRRVDAKKIREHCVTVMISWTSHGE